MCTLTQDDTQSSINPTALDEWTPRPQSLLRRRPVHPAAAPIKVTQGVALCEGSGLFIFHHHLPEAHTA